MRTKKGKVRSFFLSRLSVRRKVRFRYMHATININNPPLCDHNHITRVQFQILPRKFLYFFWTVGRQFGLTVDLSEVQNDDDDDEKKTSGRHCSTPETRVCDTSTSACRRRRRRPHTCVTQPVRPFRRMDDSATTRATVKVMGASYRQTSTTVPVRAIRER